MSIVVHLRHKRLIRISRIPDESVKAMSWGVTAP